MSDLLEILRKAQYISEDEFIKKFNLPDEHCNSCHMDAEEGFYEEMIEHWAEDNSWYSNICCVVFNNYEAENKK